MLRLPNSQSVAATLSWPGKLSDKYGRDYPWSFPIPTRRPVSYWMTPEQANVFRAARDDAGPPRPLADFLVVNPDSAVAVRREPIAAVEPVVPIGVDEVPLEAVEVDRYEVRGTATREAVQREAALADRFQNFLTERQHRVRRYRVTPDGASAPLYSDIADITSRVLYEAKGTADRMAVRLALGQVLDYGRYVRRVVPDIELAVLLPEYPPGDIIDLLKDYDVGCVVELSSGTFIDSASLDRCPE